MSEFSEFIELLLPWGNDHNPITDGFVSVIISTFVILLLVFLWKTIRRSRLINGLSKEVGKYNRPAEPSIKHSLEVEFERNQLAEVWQEFSDSLITRNVNENREVVYKTDDASLFFGEDRLLDQHLNLRFWNSVPALLVGFGILGTFVGLVWGLISFADINFASTTAIGNAIKELLSGVSTAFVTSVWGMLTSLLFNGLEKWRIGRVSRAISNLQRTLDQLFTLTTQEAISFRQEDELAQQTAALKSFSTDLANQIKSAMTQGRQEIIQELHNAPEAFSSAMAKQLEPSLDSLNKAVEELRQQKEESSTDAIQRLVEEFRESLSGSTTAQLEGLAETVGSASESLTALPEQLTSMMAGVQEQIDRSRQLLADTSQDQSGQMKNMMDEMLKAFQNAVDTHQSRLSATANSANEEITRIAADIRDLLTSAANQADEQLARRITDIEAISAQSIQSLEAAITGLQQSLTSTASQTAEESQGMVTRMLEFIESAANRADEQLARRITDIEAVSAQSIQSLETAIAELQKALTSTASQTAEESQGMVTRMVDLLESVANRADSQFAQRTTDIEAVSAQSIQTLETAIAELQQSLTSTLDAQQQTIQSITSKTEAASVASIDRIRQLAEQSAERLEKVIQAGEQGISVLLNQQGDQIRVVTDQIANSQATLVKGREILEEMNAGITNVRQMTETTRALSNQLMMGAEGLERAGQQLTQASSAFNQENENYLATNRETIQQLQGTLVQSRDLLSDFARRFQTIDAGLNSIFSEIQRGLNEYATTSRDSINMYLSSFSTQLTSAANALAGSVEALGGNVEVLNDMIEGFRRR